MFLPLIVTHLALLLLSFFLLRSEYGRYSASIRREYIAMSLDAYLRGRLSVLQGFLQRPQLYFSDEFLQLAESRARYNLAKEIERIRAAPEMIHSHL